MAQTGWHLSKVSLFGSYHFNSGDPAHIVYRLDYQPTSKARDLHEYLTFFEDAGWEYVGEMSNWRYWRKAVAPGETAEIFTDNESKVRKYRRLMLFLGFIFILLLVLGNSLFFSPTGFGARNGDFGIFVTVIQLIYLALYTIYIYIFVRLYLRIRSLKRTLL
jgi:hypothetical protein